MRTPVILSTLALSASVLAGCGGDGGSSSSAYCDDLKAAKAEFASFDSSTPDFEKFGEAIDTFHDLADGAPSEVADEWKTLDDALTKLEANLKDVGLELKDLGAITQNQLPEGMTQEELAAAMPKLQAAFQDLTAEKFKTASDKIEKHAKSECDIDLSED